MKERMGALFGAMNRTRTAAMLVAAGSLLAGCAGTQGGAKAPCDCPEAATVPMFAPEDTSRLSFDAMVGRMSDSLLHVPAGTAWRPATGRAAEVRDARADLSLLFEDAEWVLALSRALDGPLPQEDKARLRRLHEAYAARAPHAQVAAQVSALLETVRDENLRRDLKKLANRSWERERSAARPPAPPPAPPPPEPVAPVPAPAPAAEPQAASDSSDASASPERFCSEKRAEAAALFSEARGTSDAAARARLLRQSLEALDACILRHPGTAEAAKARQNRERVEQELTR